MLLQLNIRNFALVKEISVEFGKGFNVLSGETGSGKSIIIDSINFVLGSKFNKSLIRTGEERTYVEGIFTIENNKTKEILNEFGIEYEDLLIISREAFLTGKSVAKINGKAMILSQLRKISETLIELHGQHESQKLLNASTHIEYLDSFGKHKLNKVYEAYLTNYNSLKQIENKMNKLENERMDLSKKLDYIKFQIDDIDNAKLNEKEEEDLKEQFSILTNTEKLDNVLSRCHNILYNGNDGSISIYDNLNIVVTELKRIEDMSKGIQPIIEILQNTYFDIEQSIQEISNLKSNIYYDKNDIEFINERLFIIEQYKKKYGTSIQEILNYREELERQLFEIENNLEILKDLEKQKSELMEVLNETAKELHDNRCVIAKQLEQKIKKEFDFIGLEKCSIKINVQQKERYNEKGFDEVIFMISTNPGEPLKPLDNIVSGGELSRIMLALKTVFIENDMIPTVIFDEIDTGISGRTAQSVAEKMYKISLKHQVLCITHLPQIASMADNNFLVNKEVVSNKTYTNIQKMKHVDKMNHIAKMIGGSKITDLALKHSEEMLNLANENKKNII